MSQHPLYRRYGVLSSPKQSPGPFRSGAGVPEDFGAEQPWKSVALPSQMLSAPFCTGDGRSQTSAMRLSAFLGRGFGPAILIYSPRPEPTDGEMEREQGEIPEQGKNRMPVFMTVHGTLLME